MIRLLMKRIDLLLFVLLGCLGAGITASAQSGRVKDPASSASTGEANKPNDAKPADPNESLTAAQLFEDADTYTKKKFAEFEKRQMPYDQRLEEKIKQEQRDLAGQHATVLAARKLEGQDVYYLGLLYNLARNFDAALEAMRRFLTENHATGEPAQNARAIIVIQAAKKGLLPEAEIRLKEYAQNQPQVADDRYSLENWMVSGYFKTRDYRQALPHAQELWAAAKVAAKKKGSFARDTMLNEAMTLLSETELKLEKKDQAIADVRELRAMSFSLPSGNLYRLALRRLGQLDPRIDPFKFSDDSTEVTTGPPAILVDEWIDQQPTKLSELRGRVVLLDFWATWCGPCRVTLPRLQSLHQSYKNKGLVILGMTNFFGRAEGKPLTRVQEMDYLRDFKKKFRLQYGFAIADSEENDRNYAVSSIPTTFLIDRRGVVRFISVGSSDAEAVALNKMIKKLIDEPAPSINAAGAQ